MRRIFFIPLFILLFSASSSSQVNLDSLYRTWKDPHQQDTTRMLAMKNYVWKGYLFTKPDSAFFFAGQALEFARKIRNPKYEADLLNTQAIALRYAEFQDSAITLFKQSIKIRQQLGDKRGTANSLGNLAATYLEKGDYADAEIAEKQSLSIREEMNNKDGIASSLNDLGLIYSDQAKFKEAITCYIRAMKIQDELGDKKAMGYSLNNIGVIYKNQGDLDKAIEFYNRSLSIAKEIKEGIGIATCYNNLADVYDSKGDFAAAMKYNLMSLEINKKIGDKPAIATSLNNIGAGYFKHGDNGKALVNLRQAAAIREEINDLARLGSTYVNLGSVYDTLHNQQQAMYYMAKAYEVAKATGNSLAMKNATEGLYLLYKKAGKYKEALGMHETFIRFRDSISNENASREVLKQEMKYTYDMKAAADSVKNAEEKRIAAAELKQEKTQRFALYGGLLLVVLFSIFMVNRFRITNNQKKIIEQKEKETKRQNLEIAHQKNLVEEKQKEIVDSINYAQRIQKALLAGDALLQAHLPSYFIYYSPKDIVSGDFYWASRLENGNFAMMTADSTGHGVPGAIMSMLNIACINEAVNSRKLTSPKDILNYTRERVISYLASDGSQEGGKDGMDCSLLCFDLRKNTISYSLANNPFWLVRNGDISEFAADKMPVGRHEELLSFSEKTITFQPGDMIYTATDGFSDQFGGNKGKKYMHKNFRELLLRISSMEISSQRGELESELSQWKGDFEQVDDICVIGIKL